VAAFLGRPRDALALIVLSVVACATSSVAHPGFGDESSVRELVVHGADLIWRGALTVAMSVYLTRRADRIRSLAESRRSLVTQALGAEARARRELAHVLHDELVQGLLSARQDLKAARRGRPGYLDRAERALGDAIAELRREIFELHPHQLESGGLAEALRAVAERQAPAGGAPAAVAVGPEAEGVADELAFAIGRELLTNAGRHAQAAHVALTVAREGGRLAVRCEDDGRGMEAARRGEALGSGHLGLAACTERVEALGGRLVVDSAPGNGTRVRAEIPADEAPRRRRPAAGEAAAPAVG
jgi:two-component system, NarL family, sensor kinase